MFDNAVVGPRGSPTMPPKNITSKGDDAEQKKVKRASALKGEGCDPKKVQSVLNLLKYRVKGKNVVKAQDAEQALQVYRSLAAPEERKSFLQQFEIAGSGKGPTALKFAVTFRKSLSAARTLPASKKKDAGLFSAKFSKTTCVCSTISNCGTGKRRDSTRLTTACAKRTRVSCWSAPPI